MLVVCTNFFTICLLGRYLIVRSSFIAVLRRLPMNSTTNSSDEIEAPNTRKRHALAATSRPATVTTASNTSTARTSSATTEGKETEKRLYTQWSNQAWQLFFEGLKQHGKDFEAIRLYIAGKLKREAKTYDQVRYFFYNTMNRLAPYSYERGKRIVHFDQLLRMVQKNPVQSGSYVQRSVYNASFNRVKGNLLLIIAQRSLRGELSICRVVELKLALRRFPRQRIKIYTPSCAALDKFVVASQRLMAVQETVSIELVPQSNKDDGYVNFHCHQSSHLSLQINSKLPVTSIFDYLQKKWFPDGQDCERASKIRIILFPDGFVFYNRRTVPEAETKSKKNRKYSIMSCFPPSDDAKTEEGDGDTPELSIYNDGISCDISPSILISHLFEMAGQKEAMRLRYKFEESHPEQSHVKGNSAFSFFAGDTLALNRPSLFSKKYIEVAEDLRKLSPGNLTESTFLPSTSSASTSKKLISFRKKYDLSKNVEQTSKTAPATAQSQRAVVDCEAHMDSSNIHHLPFETPIVTTASKEASVEETANSTIFHTHYCQPVEVIEPQQNQQQEHQQQAVETNTQQLRASPSTSLQVADQMNQNTLLPKETPIPADITETTDTADLCNVRKHIWMDSVIGHLTVPVIWVSAQLISRKQFPMMIQEKFDTADVFCQPEAKQPCISTLFNMNKITTNENLHHYFFTIDVSKIYNITIQLVTMFIKNVQHQYRLRLFRIKYKR
ncbi:Protein cramped-like [Trichinella nelsoni]|uniref:Protein cramped-like n=1 Tax=Trichinella nelsoni TaxID=6336 RepID=A0A0V0SLT4_9BILA|nr:Protein cramped-like [Trichinella nelsoni]